MEQVERVERQLYKIYVRESSVVYIQTCVKTAVPSVPVYQMNISLRFNV